MAMLVAKVFGIATTKELQDSLGRWLKGNPNIDKGTCVVIYSLKRAEQAVVASDAKEFWPFGSLLANFRREKNMEKAVVATASGISTPVIHRYERMQSYPEHGRTVIRLAEALGLNPQETSDLLDAWAYGFKTEEVEEAPHSGILPGMPLS